MTRGSMRSDKPNSSGENGVDASISTRIKFIPFPCVCVYAGLHLRSVKTKRSISTRKFCYVCPVKALLPDFLRLSKMTVAVVDF